MWQSIWQITHPGVPPIRALIRELGIGCPGKGSRQVASHGHYPPYVFIDRMRAKASQGTELANAQFYTLFIKPLKLTAVVTH